MGKKEKRKQIKKKEKKAKVKKPGWKIHKLYSLLENKLERKNKYCPKCGPGVFMGKHKERFVCGKCQYVEFFEKKENKK